MKKLLLALSILASARVFALTAEFTQQPTPSQLYLQSGPTATTFSVGVDVLPNGVGSGTVTMYVLSLNQSIIPFFKQCVIAYDNNGDETSDNCDSMSAGAEEQGNASFQVVAFDSNNTNYAVGYSNGVNVSYSAEKKK